jgi:TrmH family RNA methyltransferase
VPLTARSPRVSAARRLAKRAFRTADRRFLVEGPQGVGEALALAGGTEPGALLELFTTAEAADRHADLVAQATALGLPVHRVGGEVMSVLAQTVTPQGLLGVAAFRDVPLSDVVAARPRLVAVLAAVRDPGNAGTVLRAADAAGADAVVFTDASVDPYNAKCVRASAGSLFHLPFVLGAPVAEAIGALRDGGATVLAAAANAAEDLDERADSGGLAAPTAWLFGNEAWGLPADVQALADAAVRVPIYGRAESLNLAAAAAVCLYASARAQRAAGAAATSA